MKLSQVVVMLLLSGTSFVYAGDNDDKKGNNFLIQSFHDTGYFVPKAIKNAMQGGGEKNNNTVIYELVRAATLPFIFIEMEINGTRSFWGVPHMYTKKFSSKL